MFCCALAKRETFNICCKRQIYLRKVHIKKNIKKKIKKWLILMSLNCMAQSSSLANWWVLPCAARNVYSVQCTLCTQCTVYSVPSVQCTLYTVLRATEYSHANTWNWCGDIGYHVTSFSLLCFNNLCTCALFWAVWCCLGL